MTLGTPRNPLINSFTLIQILAATFVCLMRRSVLTIRTNVLLYVLVGYFIYCVIVLLLMFITHEAKFT